MSSSFPRIPPCFTALVATMMVGNCSRPQFPSGDFEIVDVPMSGFQLLRAAHAVDYITENMKIVTLPYTTETQPSNGRGSCREVPASIEASQHIFFSQGDFIKFWADRLGRLDQIFLFDVWGTVHTYICGHNSNVKYRRRRRDVNISTILILDKDQLVIIGITAIEAVKPYIVRIDDHYLLVLWEIHWMWRTGNGFGLDSAHRQLHSAASAPLHRLPTVDFPAYKFSRWKSSSTGTAD
ncbi:hypothetical protein GGR54DRAFT_238695 [Hypoxylon sp. NC1633]|nr:hypothetical protein GGR54DRAFT_238695 [Hypoxylon sp. NC1633]